MVRVWFPNMFMRLININTNKTPAQAVLHIPPKMTKFEIKQYLTKIYNIPVINVMTANFLGRWKRLYAKRRVISYKRRNFKKAIVEFDAAAEAAGSSVVTIARKPQYTVPQYNR